MKWVILIIILIVVGVCVAQPSCQDDLGDHNQDDEDYIDEEGF